MIIDRKVDLEAVHVFGNVTLISWTTKQFLIKIHGINA
jgi:hypothetical protein